MKAQASGLRLSAGDLSNHLGCRHLTQLDLRVARGELERPSYYDAALEALKQRGFEHERAYIEHLRGRELSVREPGEGPDATLAAMREGADVIVQPTLATGRWLGRADVLLRVGTPSELGDWSYEVVDTKLARETRAGTVLQLCLYSDILGELQGLLPAQMHVVSPGRDFEPTSFRVADYMAYYRLVRTRLEAAVDGPVGETYPDPVPHCDLCRWWKRCDSQRRADDHLSFVAGLSTLQARELHAREVRTLEALAREPLPLAWKPTRGSTEGFVRVREQARVQREGRTRGEPVHELLPRQAGRGLERLPAPSPGDVFFDIEGDAFVGEHGLEYLFGWAVLDDGGKPAYRSGWALGVGEERSLFESFIDEVMARWREHPDLHVYHFAPYEPAALKRLMGRYATREDEVDRMLRAGLFVDLHAVLKQSARASVERYGLKQLEPFFEFERELALETARPNIHALEHALELGAVDEIPPEVRAAVEAYNRDDCISTLYLRDWLERLRATLTDAGEVIPRPAVADGAPPERVTQDHLAVVALMTRLLDGVPDDPSERDELHRARWLLAHMLEWHRREQKAPWWEYFRLLALSDEDLLDERDALSGLSFECEVPVPGRQRVPVHRYRYPKQETSIREGAELLMTDKAELGTVVDMELLARTVDVKKTGRTIDTHPTAVFVHFVPPVQPRDEALRALGQWVADHDIDAPGDFRAARDLLLRRPPRLRAGSDAALRREGETSLDAARRLVLALDHGVLPIQGPPGSGKTYTAARMITALVRAGKRVGVTAVSHKVIRHVLDCVIEAADEESLDVQCVRKIGTEETPSAREPRIEEVRDNAAVDRAVASHRAHVIGGTAWLWSRPDMDDAVDVLFVDEAGQMSLADTLASARGHRSLVLLGDPQQLEQPIQGAHPDGTATSALEHVLGGHATMPSDLGLFLDETWRLHPSIAAFTSEVFYEGRLRARAGCERRILTGDTPFTGAGLWYVPVVHEGNQSASPEEVAVIARLVEDLTATRIVRFSDGGRHAPCLTIDDLLIVAPYNVQVADLSERIPGARIGTVDRFQGQEAPVVIYSLTSSSHEDAPRGMEFLYNLNRLNVATSRAKCTCILVGSPRLFEPECKSPRQMRLANALCRYLEMARRVE